MLSHRDDDNSKRASIRRHRLPYQLRHLRSDLDVSDEIGQGRDWDTAEVMYGEGDSRSDVQLVYFVSLDSRGRFELFWDVDTVTETIQFRLDPVSTCRRRQQVGSVGVRILRLRRTTKR